MLIFPLSSLAGWPGGRQPRPRIYSSRPLILLFLAHLVKDRQTLWISCHLRFNSGMCTQASPHSLLAAFSKHHFQAYADYYSSFMREEVLFEGKAVLLFPYRNSSETLEISYFSHCCCTSIIEETTHCSLT